MTYRAVVRYQQARGLLADGVVGRQTGTALGIWGTRRWRRSGRVRRRHVVRWEPRHAPINTAAAPWLIGSPGALSTVAAHRARLPGRPDSTAPSATMTHNGVVRYQRAKGLLADGVVGRQTGTSLGIWGTAASGGGTAGATNVHAPAGVPASARQVVVVNSSGSRADVDLLMFGGGRWTCARMDMPARVGRNGVRALANRRSGDGTTPGGVFPLGSMTAPRRADVPVLRQRCQPGRTRHLAPSTGRRLLGGDPRTARRTT